MYSASTQKAMSLEMPTFELPASDDLAPFFMDRQGLVIEPVAIRR